MVSSRFSILLSLACLAIAAPAFADGSSQHRLSLDPTVVTADDEPQTGLIMMGLDKLGVGKTLEDNKIKIYGWIEGGYTYDHRHHGGESALFARGLGSVGSPAGPIIPGPFDHEFGNHFMLNQIVVRFEKQVDSTKFDVGGMIELMYGSDAARIHSTGMGFNGSDATDDNNPTDDLAVSNRHPILQFDIPQAYVDVNIPVGNGLKIRVGKFVTLMGYETIDPRGNPFYSHSYLFSAVPFTQTGILGMYNINDQWAVTAGISRGWDITLEDNNGCAIDFIGQVAYTPNKSWTVLVNWSIGPEDRGDTGHYRTAIDPIVKWQVTDQLMLAAEGLYIYDGGMNSGHYGDFWGGAVYGQYKINDYLTANARAEEAHSFANSFGAFGNITTTLPILGSVPSINVFDATLGVSITPMPHDPIGRNLVVRPEIRYQWSEDHIFLGGTNVFKDQLTFGVDAIFQF